MRFLFLFSFLALISGGCSEQHPASARLVEWADRTLPVQAAFEADPSEGQVVAVSADGALSVVLLEIQQPQIETASSSYSLEGRVRHEAVAGDAYLEMWSFFPDGSQFFSRTLADSGPMQTLSGESGWRDFQLPFQLGPKADDPGFRPVKITFGVVLPAGGRVWVSALELRQN